MSAIRSLLFGSALAVMIIGGMLTGCGNKDSGSATTTNAPANQGPKGSSMGYTVPPEQQSQIQAAQKADSDRLAAMQNQQNAPKK